MKIYYNNVNISGILWEYNNIIVQQSIMVFEINPRDSVNNIITMPKCFHLMGTDSVLMDIILNSMKSMEY